MSGCFCPAVRVYTCWLGAMPAWLVFAVSIRGGRDSARSQHHLTLATRRELTAGRCPMGWAPQVATRPAACTHQSAQLWFCVGFSALAHACPRSSWMPACGPQRGLRLLACLIRFEIEGRSVGGVLNPTPLLKQNASGEHNGVGIS